MQRTIRQKVLDTYPLLEPHIEDIMPKKEQLDLVKLYDFPPPAFRSFVLSTFWMLHFSSFANWHT